MGNNVAIRAWQSSDASAIATTINNRAVQDNLRDGIRSHTQEKTAKNL